MSLKWVFPLMNSMRTTPYNSAYANGFNYNVDFSGAYTIYSSGQLVQSGDTSHIGAAYAACEHHASMITNQQQTDESESAMTEQERSSYDINHELEELYRQRRKLESSLRELVNVSTTELNGKIAQLKQLYSMAVKREEDERINEIAEEYYGDDYSDDLKRAIIAHAHENAQYDDGELDVDSFRESLSETIEFVNVVRKFSVHDAVETCQPRFVVSVFGGAKIEFDTLDDVANYVIRTNHCSDINVLEPKTGKRLTFYRNLEVDDAIRQGRTNLLHDYEAIVSKKLSMQFDTDV